MSEYTNCGNIIQQGNQMHCMQCKKTHQVAALEVAPTMRWGGRWSVVLLLSAKALLSPSSPRFVINSRVSATGLAERDESLSPPRECDLLYVGLPRGAASGAWYLVDDKNNQKGIKWETGGHQAKSPDHWRETDYACSTCQPASFF